MVVIRQELGIIAGLIALTGGCAVNPRLETEDDQLRGDTISLPSRLRLAIRYILNPMVVLPTFAAATFQRRRVDEIGSYRCNPGVVYCLGPFIRKVDRHQGFAGFEKQRHHL